MAIPTKAPMMIDSAGKPGIPGVAFRVALVVVAAGMVTEAVVVASIGSVIVVLFDER